MPAPSLHVTYAKALRDIQILSNYRTASLTLEPKFQHFVAEVVLIRLFSIVESAIKESALKLSCRAQYRNGTTPSLVVNCRSLVDAESKFINYNRTRPVNLKWTKASFINNSIKEVIPSSESFRVQILHYSQYLNEMRKVRNHIAHRTSSTYNDYKSVIQTNFGAQLRIQPGAFLTSTKRITTPKIDAYISTSRIMINDITNG